MNTDTPLALAISMPGGMEWIIILAIGLLIFGKRLPEVGRSLGRGIVEFKRGVKGIEDELDEASGEPSKKKAEAPKLETPTDESGEDLRVSRGAESPSPQSGS